MATTLSNIERHVEEGEILLNPLQWDLKCQKGSLPKKVFPAKRNCHKKDHKCKNNKETVGLSQEQDHNAVLTTWRVHDVEV